MYESAQQEFESIAAFAYEVILLMNAGASLTLVEAAATAAAEEAKHARWLMTGLGDTKDLYLHSHSLSVSASSSALRKQSVRSRAAARGEEDAVVRLRKRACELADTAPEWSLVLDAIANDEARHVNISVAAAETFDVWRKNPTPDFVRGTSVR